MELGIFDPGVERRGDGKDTDKGKGTQASK